MICVFWVEESISSGAGTRGTPRKTNGGKEKKVDNFETKKKNQ
jgi:hypothetical protein